MNQRYQVLKADSTEQRLGYQWVGIDLELAVTVAAFVTQKDATTFCQRRNYAYANDAEVQTLGAGER